MTIVYYESSSSSSSDDESIINTRTKFKRFKKATKKFLKKFSLEQKVDVRLLTPLASPCGTIRRSDFYDSSESIDTKPSVQKKPVEKPYHENITPEIMDRVIRHMQEEYRFLDYDLSKYVDD